MSDEHVPPRAFISYSWSSPEHEQWVLSLATRLRQSDGVDVVLDKWHLMSGQDKYQFMEQMVQDPTIQKVLMICDRSYAEKADARRGGVGDETLIVSPEVYGSVKQSKFIPIIAEKGPDGEPYKPHYLKSRIHVDLSDVLTFEENYERLLRDIYDRPLYTPPPVGRPPSFLQPEGEPRLRTAYRYQTFRHGLLNNRTTVAGLAGDYLEELAEALQEFCLQDGQGEAEDLGDRVRKSIAASLPQRDEYVDFIADASRYGADPRVFAAVQQFFVGAAGQTFPAQRSNIRSVQPLRFIVPELFLYTVAALLRHDHFEAVEALLAQPYHSGGFQQQIGSYRVYTYSVFRPRVALLDEASNFHLFNAPSPTADILTARMPHPRVSAIEITNADFVLYARYVLAENQALWDAWDPVTRPYVHYDQPLPFFLNARARVKFERAKGVLGVGGKQDLLARFEAHVQRLDQGGGTGRGSHTGIDRKLLGIDEMGTQ